MISRVIILLWRAGPVRELTGYERKPEPGSRPQHPDVLRTVAPTGNREVSQGALNREKMITGGIKIAF